MWYPVNFDRSELVQVIPVYEVEGCQVKSWMQYRYSLHIFNRKVSNEDLEDQNLKSCAKIDGETQTQTQTKVIFLHTKTL